MVNVYGSVHSSAPVGGSGVTLDPGPKDDGRDGDDDHTEIILNSGSSVPPVRLGNGLLPAIHRGLGARLRFGSATPPAGMLEGAKTPIPNFGRTCYAAALLQSFSACIQRDTDEEKVCRIFKCHERFSCSCLPCAVKAAISDHHFNRKTFLSSLGHLFTLQGKHPYNFGIGWDRDPSEYLTLLIKDVKLDYSNPLVGTYRSITTCLNCGLPNSSLPQMYSYMILPVRASGTISEIIAASMEPERLPDLVECPRCMPTCGRRTAATKRIVYDTFPTYLFMFFTQYRYNQDAPDQILKTTEIVHVSESLELSIFGPAGNGLQGQLVSSIVHTSSPDHFTASVKARDGHVHKMDDAKTAILLPFDTVNQIPVYGRVFVVSKTGPHPSLTCDITKELTLH